MSDLRTLLHEAAPQPTAVSELVVERDLVRARRALRVRRARRTGIAGGLVAASTLAALAVVNPGSAPSTPSATVSTQPGDAGIELVAYTGAQPSGFELDKVPAGWAVRDSTPSLLTLAPEGTSAPATAGGPTSLVGTIAVSTQSDTGIPSGVRLDDVTVGGRPAVIAHMLGSGDTRTLFLEQAPGTYLTIQVWDGLGWDNARIAEFAASVHVTGDAKPTVG
ncbi:hypothetical protein [Aeromicrobium fastidiosum]|uniref:Uncharacterized protein n=1 Tax=Aeromicrobium fastidiosum TaxID=52699 RepID=A0A641AQM0_9ACTN|nr:hypothetical protein [Aeromicrobium fastidiosum]KAA1380390.1 hypothetical protein ESP62_004185 [Aeromicrobium fastidiosum]MBP2389963.1 hypothetical protein [Aeromicrobium fastidiosum]